MNQENQNTELKTYLKKYSKEVGEEIAKALSMAVILDGLIGTQLMDKVLVEVSNKMKKM